MALSGPYTKYDKPNENIKLESETWWDGFNRLPAGKLRYHIRKLKHQLQAAEDALAYRQGDYDPDLRHWRFSTRLKAKAKRIFKRMKLLLCLPALFTAGCAGIHNAPADLQMINDQVQTQMAYDRHNDDWHPFREHWARGCPATGDCEDFAICAIEKMREAGIISPNEMAVIELWDLNGNERGVHAFARFKRDGINWAIDPTSKGVFTTDHWNAQRDLYGICTQRHATDPVWYCGTKDGIAIR